MTADLDAIMKKATEDLTRAAYRKGYEAGWKRATAEMTSILNEGWIITHRMQVAIKADGLRTDAEIAQEAAQQQQYEQDEKGFEAAQAEELAEAVAAEIARRDAERPLIAPSPEPDVRPLMIEGPTVEDVHPARSSDAPVPAAQVKQDAPIEPADPGMQGLVRQPDGSTLRVYARPANWWDWTPERHALIRKMWPTYATRDEIDQELRKLPGNTGSSGSIAGQAALLGVTRPADFASRLGKKGADRAWANQRGAAPPPPINAPQPDVGDFVARQKEIVREGYEAGLSDEQILTDLKNAGSRMILRDIPPLAAAIGVARPALKTSAHVAEAVPLRPEPSPPAAPERPQPAITAAKPWLEPRAEPQQRGPAAPPVPLQPKPINETMTAKRDEIRRKLAERDAIIKRDIPLGLTDQAIVANILKGVPGFPIRAQDIAGVAKFLGVARPKQEWPAVPAKLQSPANPGPAPAATGNGKHGTTEPQIADFTQIEQWAAQRGIVFTGHNLDEINARCAKIGRPPFELKHGPGWRA